MRFLHLADLHFGKKLGEFSMIDEQKNIVAEILKIIDEERVEAVLIAGDVFDKSIPPIEAISLYDNFLARLEERSLKVFIISGNHDSSERLSCGNQIMSKAGFYISPTYRGDVKSVRLEDEFGPINIYLLPFIRPSHVRHYHEDADVTTYTDAMNYVIDSMKINKAERNILVAHQFVDGAERSDSEEVFIGGLDNVSADVFSGFDYVALGHLHRPQSLNASVRYAGTPLKYSFSEVNNKKSVTIIDINAKGCVNIEERYLHPINDLREIRGKYNEIASKEYYADKNITDYLHITLTDEDDIPYAISKLRTIYPNILKLDYDNKRTRSEAIIDGADVTEEKSPLEMFEDLYKKQNATSLSEEQTEYLTAVIDDIWRNRE